MRSVVITIAIVSVGITGCASKRPPKPFQLLAAEFVSPVSITKPIDAKSAVIGITIKSDKWPPGTENRVYLVRVDSDGNLYRGTNSFLPVWLRPCRRRAEEGRCTCRISSRVGMLPSRTVNRREATEEIGS